MSNEPNDLPDQMPRRPTGDVGQGARETPPHKDDPESLAEAVEAIKRARGW